MLDLAAGGTGFLTHPSHTADPALPARAPPQRLGTGVSHPCLWLPGPAPALSGTKRALTSAGSIVDVTGQPLPHQASQLLGAGSSFSTQLSAFSTIRCISSCRGVRRLRNSCSSR